jgi:hypothetical protein
MNVKSIKIGKSPSISVDYAGEGEMLIFLHGIGGNKRTGKITFIFFLISFCQLHGIQEGMVKAMIMMEH